MLRCGTPGQPGDEAGTAPVKRPTFGVFYAGAGGARDAAGAEALMNLGVTHIVTSTRATGPSDLPASLAAYHEKVIGPLG
jgi:hypothetical protein